SIALLMFGSVDQVAARLIDIAFPALSEVARDRRTNLKGVYFQLHTVITTFAYLCSGILMASGQTLINFLYDPRYHDAGWMLQILAAALATTPFRLSTQFYMVFGIPRIYSHVLTLRLVALFVFTPVGFLLFGVVGALWGIVLSYF